MLDRRWFASHRLSRLLLAAVVLGTTPALAQNATWDGSGFPTVFNNPDNWDTGLVPTGTATLAGAAPFNIGASLDVTVGSIAVTGGAYTLTPDVGRTFTLNGAGIVNTSGSAFVINVIGAFLELDGASAGNATINNAIGAVTFSGAATLGTGTVNTVLGGLTSFTDTSSAGAGTLLVGDSSLVQFGTNSRAGTATITVLANGLLIFMGASTAEDATITVQDGGALLLGELATGGNARFVIEAGGIMDLAGLFGAATPTAGSIEGGGDICLCNTILTVGSNNRSTTFSGVITSGPSGGLTKVGTGTLILSGINGYLGPTTVNGGVLVVNGSIATSSLLTVNPGGTIGGTGELPSTVIAGGILAPGNSVGTVTVNGNLTLGAGSTYLVEVDTAAADRANVTGTATITGSTVRFVRAGGPLSFFQRYTILNAAGGVTGTFATVDNQLGPAIRASVSYDPNNVFLTLDPNALLAVLGGTPLTVNQRSVAAGIDNAVLGGANPTAFLPLFALPAGAIPAALDQLGGEVHTARTALGFEVSDQFLRVMLDPFAPGRRAAAGPVLAYGPGALAGGEALVAATQAADLAAAEPARIDPRRFALWASAFGADSRVGGDAVIGSHRLSTRNVNLAIGADWRPAPDTILGIAAAGGSADASVAGLGSLSAEVGQVGAYAMTRFGGLNIGAALAYALLEVDSRRTVPVLGIANLASDTTVHALSGRIEASFSAVRLAGVEIAPLAAFQAHAIRAPAFTETAGIGAVPAAALAVQGGTQHVSRAELGVRVEGRLPLEALEVTGFARLAWARYFERDATIAAAFVGLPGSGFSVTGARPDRDAALVSAGFEVRPAPGFALGARFDGEFSGNVTRYGGSARARLEF